MGDRTSYTIAVAGTDQAEDAYISRRLYDAIETEESGDGHWVIYEHSVGALDEIAEILNEVQRDLDNAFAFRVWEDPKYEWDGQWAGWIPGLGTSGGLCDGNGSTHVEVSELRKLADEARQRRRGTHPATGKQTHAGTVLTALLRQLDALTRREWEDAWEALMDKTPEADREGAAA